MSPISTVSTPSIVVAENEINVDDLLESEGLRAFINSDLIILIGSALLQRLLIVHSPVYLMLPACRIAARILKMDQISESLNIRIFMEERISARSFTSFRLIASLFNHFIKSFYKHKDIGG